MAQLAIKGHATRGKEVIEIIQMLGGKTRHGKYEGQEFSCGYYINVDGYIGFKHYLLLDDTMIFTLEEFLEKYPYKVGDKVQHKGATSCGSVFEVKKMRWEEDTVKYTLRLFGCNYKSSTLPAEYLQPYKEAPMYLNEKANKQAEEIEKILEPVKEIMEEIKLDIPDGYEFFGIDDDNKVVLTKKQPQYPKTYEECCKVLCCKPIVGFAGLDDDEENLYGNFIALKRCRDAYWKIVGEQMGLDKSWGSDWEKADEIKYCIVNAEGNITKWVQKTTNKILAFPTEEICDTFYENFKKLIEDCKELL